MASIKEILEKENPKDSVIHLYREGIFYKAYGYSAFLFVNNIRQYKVKKIYYKSFNLCISSVGLPSKVLDEIILSDNISLIEHTNNYCSIRISDNPIDLDKFNLWNDNIEIEKKKTSDNKVDELSLEQEDIVNKKLKILDEIKSFHLESSTPLGCMIFLSEMRAKLSEIEKQ